MQDRGRRDMAFTPSLSTIEQGQTNHHRHRAVPSCDGLAPRGSVSSNHGGIYSLDPTSQDMCRRSGRTSRETSQRPVLAAGSTESPERFPSAPRDDFWAPAPSRRCRRSARIPTRLRGLDPTPTANGLMGGRVWTQADVLFLSTVADLVVSRLSGGLGSWRFPCLYLFRNGIVLLLHIPP